MRVTLMRGRKALATRSVKLGASCHFSAMLAPADRLLGTAKRLTVVARFGGNASVRGASRSYSIATR